MTCQPQVARVSSPPSVVSSISSFCKVSSSGTRTTDPEQQQQQQQHTPRSGVTSAECIEACLAVVLLLLLPLLLLFPLLLLPPLPLLRSVVLHTSRQQFHNPFSVSEGSSIRYYSATTPLLLRYILPMSTRRVRRLRIYVHVLATHTIPER